VPCSDEIAVRSCPLLCLQEQVANLARRLFYCWSLLHNNNTAINLQKFPSSYGKRRFSAWVQGSHCRLFPPGSALLVDMSVRGIMRLDGAPMFEPEIFRKQISFWNKCAIAIQHPGYCDHLAPLLCPCWVSRFNDENRV